MSSPDFDSTSQSTADVSTQEGPDTLLGSNSSQTTHEPCGAELPNEIYPSSPSQTRRYKLSRTIEDEAVESVILKPLSLSFTDELPPPGWQRHVHPEGLPYFCSQRPAGPVGPPIRILTEEWLFESSTVAKIEGYIQAILNAISFNKVAIPPMSDLVVALYPGSQECGYYFVHHPTRSIYWLEDVELNYQCARVGEIRGKVSGYQIQTCLEVEYWGYWDCFPNVQTLTPEVHEYVVDALTSAMTDLLISRDSTITHTHKDLQNMLNIVQAAKPCRTSNWYIGRFMYNIVDDRFRNYYGAWSARLSTPQAVLSGYNTRSWLFNFFSPLLFFIPHGQLARVSPIATDGCVISVHWTQVFRELQGEWGQTMTFATIILAANCAFLAIPVFGNQGSQPDSHSSPEQVASYLSLAASLFGLILSSVMSRELRINGPNSVCEIIDYIYDTRPERPRYRLEHIVLIWSLPHALVLWSVVAFLFAFLVMCFLGTYTVVKVVVGLSAGLLTSLVFYYIIRFGSGKKLRHLWSRRISRGVVKIRGLIPRISMRRERQEGETASQAGEGQV